MSFNIKWLCFVPVFIHAHYDHADYEEFNEMFRNVGHFWEDFRDPDTGLYCDTLKLSTDSTGSNDVCGSGNNRYSAASTGHGLVSLAIFSESSGSNYSSVTVIFNFC